jgi:hypothetical protein
MQESLFSRFEKEKDGFFEQATSSQSNDLFSPDDYSLLFKNSTEAISYKARPPQNRDAQRLEKKVDQLLLHAGQHTEQNNILLKKIDQLQRESKRLRLSNETFKSELALIYSTDKLKNYSSIVLAICMVCLAIDIFLNIQLIHPALIYPTIVGCLGFLIMSFISSN